MIRFATINKLGGVRKSKHTDKIISTLQQDPVDILCCKKNTSSGTDQHGRVRDLAQALGMTYTFSDIPAVMQKAGKKSHTAMAILTGKNSWMLNSGSLPLIEGQKDIRQVQFGVIRTNSNALMVLNAEFQDDASFGPKKQLKRLLDHPMLGEQFGAVALHSNIHRLLNQRELEKIVATRDIVLQQPAQACSVDASVMVFTSKIAPLAAVHIHNATALPHKFGLITNMKIIRLPKEQRQKRYLPLSFRERWLGSRDGDRVFAF